MSWCLRSYYACVTLPGVANDAGLDDLLGKFASSVLSELLAGNQSDLWSAFDDQYDEIQGDNPIPAMVARTRDFLSEIDFQDGSVSMVVQSEYDSAIDCDDLVDALARFLLPYAAEPYVLLRSASYDNGGGYAHQSICRRSGDQVVIESVPELLERLLAAPPHVINSLLDAVAA